MALAVINCQPFVARTTIGATNPQQLESNLTSAELELELPGDVLAGIEAIHIVQLNSEP